MTRAINKIRNVDFEIKRDKLNYPCIENEIIFKETKTTICKSGKEPPSHAT